MKAEFLRLDGPTTTLVLEIAADAPPLWRYWGPRLADGAAPPSAALAARPRPTFSLDVDRLLSVFPTFGLGWAGQSALLAHRDGRDFAQHFTLAGVERRGENALTLSLVDDVAAIGVDISLSLTAADVLALSTRLVNRGAAPLDILWLAAGTLPLPPEIAFARSYAGRHNNEFVVDDARLGAAIWRRENRRGLTSHDCFPGALAYPSGATFAEGRVFGMQLAWSGNHAQSIERLEDGSRQWQAGEWLAPGELRLAPGEEVATPEMLATCSTQGFDGVARNFHAECRARLRWPGGRMRPRPAHLNTWEGVYFDHREDDLFSLAEAAATLGVERFVLDDGWFVGRRDDTTSLGDWRADPDRYPRGLAPLAARVISLGMEFGLWVEPEMASPSSALLREHPDWALSLAGRPVIAGRNQLVLDMARPEVGAHLFDALDALLRTLPISYLKWDHNRELAAAGGRDGRARYRAQTLATAALIDRLRARHPGVEIESCAAGGGRIDAGMLTRATRFWTSDCLDAKARVAMQRQFLQFFPPEVMGAHVGASPAHATGRRHSMGLRALAALPGHFGVELDPRRLDADARAELSFWIKTYKSLRDRLHRDPVWRGDGVDGIVWQAHGDERGGVVFVYRTEPAALKFAAPLRLPFVSAHRRYRIEETAHPDQAFLPGAGAQLFLAMRDGCVEVDGAWLAADGLPCPPLSVDGAALLRVTAL